MGFLFPLCGFEALTGGKHVIQHIGKQITFFSRFLGSPELLELVEKLWITGTTSFLLEPNNMGIRHVVLSLTNIGIQDIGYLYLHEDKVSEANASANGDYHWRFISQKF